MAAETSSDLRSRAPVLVALGMMTLACVLIATALVLVAHGAVAQDMAAMS